jgi:hypothetical protein
VEKRPLLFIIALTATAASPLIAVLAILETNPELRSTLVALAAGLLLVGTGEILNHPLQSETTHADHDPPGALQRHHHRRRNPCSLGNLLFIFGMLLLFITLGHFISF